MKVTELKQKLLKGGVYLALRQGLTLGLSLVGLLLITRNLGPEHYGWLTLALSWVSMATEMVDLGLPYYLIRYQGHQALGLVLFQGQVLTFMMLLSGLLALAMVLLAPSLAGWVHIPQLELLVIVLSPAIALDACGRIPMALMEKELRYQNTSMVEVIALFVYYGVAIFLIFLGFGVWGVAWAYLARALSQTGIAFILHPVRPRGLSSLGVIKEALVCGLTYSLSRWLSLGRGLFIALVLGKFVGATAVGLLGMTTRIVEALCVVKAILLQLGIAGFAQLQGKLPLLRRALSLGMAYLALLLPPLLSLFACVSPLLVPWILGAKWGGVVGLFPFVALTFLARYLFDFHSLVLFTEGKNFAVLRFQAAQLGLVLILLILGAGSWGLWAYAMAELGGLAAYLLLHWSVSNLVGQPNYRPVFWSLACTLGVLFGGPYMSPWLGLVLLGAGLMIALLGSKDLRSIPAEVMKSLMHKTTAREAHP